MSTSMICLVRQKSFPGPIQRPCTSVCISMSNVGLTRPISLGGCGQAFEAMIVSPQFSGKGSLARHRLVNSALKEEIAAIHAWTPRCLTPEEWEKRQGANAAGS